MPAIPNEEKKESKWKRKGHEDWLGAKDPWFVL